MTSPLDAPAIFLQKLDEVEQKLTTFTREIDSREEAANEALKKVSEAARAPTSPVRDSAMAQAVSASVLQTRQRLEEWQKTLQETIRAREFIGKFDRSLIVLVYGKVNSGKSSLGNVVAGLPFASQKINPYDGRSVTFTEHDSSGLSSRIDRLTEIDPEKGAASGFATKATECTSSIQEFTLAGLSWIDCPGVHAVTEENEALAKKYADHAELIVYITSADAAMRRSDQEELRRFARQGKPVLLVVSKFDIMEEIDFREDGTAITVCMPKAPESRDQIKGWLENQLKESDLGKILQKRDYCFVSTKLADRALQEGDAELFAQSGIPDFYHQLAGVMTDQAVTLKTQNPRRRFNAVVEQLIGQASPDPGSMPDTETVTTLRQRFANNLTALKHTRAEIKALGRTIASRIRYKAEPDIMRMLHQMAESMDAGRSLGNDGLSGVATILQARTQEVVADELRRVLSDYDRERVQIFDGFGAIEMPTIEAVYDTIDVSEKIIYGGTGKAVGGGLGAWGGFVAGQALIPIPILGGIIGGVIGGALGGAAGGGIGESLAGTRSVKVKVGNNLQDVAKQVLDQIEATLPAEIDRILITVADDYLGALESVSAGMVRSLERLQEQLQALRYVA